MIDAQQRKAIANWGWQSDNCINLKMAAKKELGFVHIDLSINISWEDLKTSPLQRCKWHVNIHRGQRISTANGAPKMNTSAKGCRWDTWIVEKVPHTLCMSMATFIVIWGWDERLWCWNLSGYYILLLFQQFGYWTSELWWLHFLRANASWNHLSEMKLKSTLCIQVTEQTCQ